MKNMTIFIGLIILVLAIQPNAYSQTSSPFSLKRIIYQPGDNLSYPYHVFLEFEHPVVTNFEFLNVQMTNLENGIVDWVVVNLPIEPNAMMRPIHYRMDLKEVLGESDIGILEDSIEIKYSFGSYFTDISQFNSIPGINSAFIPQEAVNYYVPNGMQRSNYSAIPKFSLATDPPLIMPEEDEARNLSRGCEVPNIDLDSMLYPDPVSGDKNACAMAAAANSLKWLMQVHEEIADVDSLRGILDTLKKMMNKQADGPEDWTNVVEGKLAFIDKHKLPIHVKYQVSPYPGVKPHILSPDNTYGHFAGNQTQPNGFPDYAWISDELDKGEDIEMGIEFYCDSLGMTEDGRDTVFLVPTHGHAVVLAGYTKMGEHRYLFWKHDTDQSGPGGLIEEMGTWGKDSAGNPYLSELSETEGCRAYVDYLVSESYDPEVTFHEILPYDYGYHPIEYDEVGLHADPYHAYISFDMPVSSEFQFLNIKASHPQTLAEMQIFENIPLPPVSSGFPVRIKVDLSDIVSGDTMPGSIFLKIKIGSFETEDDFVPQSLVEIPQSSIPYLIPSGGDIGFHPLIPVFSCLTVPKTLPDTFKFLVRGCEVPNIDLDSMARPIDPEKPYSTDYLACGPAAATNSMEWLEDMHFSDDPPIDIPLNSSQILDTLKKMMKLDPNTDGVLWLDFIKGKLDFIDRYKLPISVKYQAHSSAPPSIPSPNPTYGSAASNKSKPHPEKENQYLHPDYDWLMSELEDDEDVEILYGYYCDTTIVMNGDTTIKRKRRGGHYINVTGYIEIGKRKYITYKHDVYQRGPGGTSRDNSPTAKKYTDVSEWKVDTNGYAELTRENKKNKMGESCTAFVESVITESYDPDKIFCPVKVCIPDDSGSESLREALLCSVPGQNISLGIELSNMAIHIHSEPYYINGNVTISADPEWNVSISTSTLERIFHIGPDGELTIIGITIEGGNNADGAALFNEGKLTLENVKVKPGQQTRESSSLIHNKGEMILKGENTIHKE